MANVSIVHSVVSIARSRADSADSSSAGRPPRWAASAATSPAANEPSGCWAGGQAVARPGVGRPLAAGGDLPDHAAADRLVEQLAERAAVGAEHLEALVEVVGDEEAGDGIHLQRRVDLVDAGLDPLDPGGASPRRRAGTASGRVG